MRQLSIILNCGAMALAFTLGAGWPARAQDQDWKVTGEFPHFGTGKAYQIEKGHIKQTLDARNRNAALAVRCSLTSTSLALEECADGCNRRRWLLFHQPVPGIGDCGEGDVGGNETQIIGHCLSE